jgi:hypothetical protein
VAGAPAAPYSGAALDSRYGLFGNAAVDALVTAAAEPGGTVLTGDPADLRALAGYASDVTIEKL